MRELLTDDRVEELLDSGLAAHQLEFSTRKLQPPYFELETRSAVTGAEQLGGFWIPDGDKKLPSRSAWAHDIFTVPAKKVLTRLRKYARVLEAVFEDAVIMVVEVSKGSSQPKLVLRSVRPHAPRTVEAHVRILHALASERVIDADDALRRIDPAMLGSIPAYEVAPGDVKALGTGTAASPGIAVGTAYTSAAAIPETETSAVLVTTMTSPEDIAHLGRVSAIVTSTGGTTSHAAIIAKQRGIACVVSLADATGISAGAELTVDGYTGKVYPAKLPITPRADVESVVRELATWAKLTDGVKVMVNADRPEDIAKALKRGAGGVGLCRTEHMFFNEERLWWLVRWIIDPRTSGKEKCLRKLFGFQRDDFRAIFRSAGLRPVTIRLLDPPLHEFLPRGLSNTAISERLRETTGAGFSTATVSSRLGSLAESNPMMGLRGSRLAVVHPELYVTQVEAALAAMADVVTAGVSAPKRVQIMLPMIASAAEARALITMLRAVVDRARERWNKTKALKQAVADRVLKAIRWGVMLEVPSACLEIGELLKTGIRFVSFGTNDLTQLTHGLSRDDAAHFTPNYISYGLQDSDPFVELSTQVEGLIRVTVRKIKTWRESRGIKLPISVCGEVAADPDSLRRLLDAGVDYVSVSPPFIRQGLLAHARWTLTESAEPLEAVDA